MKKLLLHAGYWTLYLALLLFMLAIVKLQAFPALFATRLGLVLIVPNVPVFYVAYGWLFPRFTAPRIAAALSLAVLLPAACVYFAGSASSADRAVLSACLTGLAIVHMAVALVLRGFVGWLEHLAVRQELEAALIGARLDPHFLFNTLNNIDVLILSNPAAASLYLNKLSELLRFVLYEARADRVPLQAELSYLEKYIEVQRIRLTNPRMVSSSVEGDPSGLSIAPMLLIPFIENAFKHAAGQRQDGSIELRIAIEGKRLSLVCGNRCGERPSRGGLGHELTRRRLALLYPHRYTLELADRGDTYTARLNVDLDDLALPHR
jgi:two-component system LytT family sensor kinase